MLTLYPKYLPKQRQHSLLDGRVALSAALKLHAPDGAVWHTFDSVSLASTHKLSG